MLKRLQDTVLAYFSDPIAQCLILISKKAWCTKSCTWLAHDVTYNNCPFWAKNSLLMFISKDWSTLSSNIVIFIIACTKLEIVHNFGGDLDSPSQIQPLCCLLSGYVMHMASCTLPSHFSALKKAGNKGLGAWILNLGSCTHNLPYSWLQTCYGWK